MDDKIEINGMTFDVGPDGRPYAFADLDEQDYPFLVRFLKEGEDVGIGQGDMVGWRMVLEPGFMDVPGFAEEGFKVSTSIQYPHGTATLITSDNQSFTAEMTADMVIALHTIAGMVERGETVNGAMPPVGP